MNDEAMAIKPSLSRRIKQKLFPQHAWEWSETRGKFMEANGERGLHVDGFTYFDWLDRLRILVTGSIHIQMSVATENEPGKSKSICQVTVLPEKPSRTR